MQNYGSHVTIEVHDNGKGFDVQSTPASSHGLAGMRHRVEAAGGKLSISSSAAEGTRVSAVVPALPQHAGAQAAA
jgi:signal transduction histidine kinase